MTAVMTSRCQREEEGNRKRIGYLSHNGVATVLVRSVETSVVITYPVTTSFANPNFNNSPYQPGNSTRRRTEARRPPEVPETRGANPMNHIVAFPSPERARRGRRIPRVDRKSPDTSTRRSSAKGKGKESEETT